MSFLERNLVKEALADLADGSMQERLWVSTEGEVGSLSESLSQLFDDSGLYRALDRGQVFDQSIDDNFRAFDAICEGFDPETRGPKELLADPRIAELRFKAAELLFAVVRFEAVESRQV